DAPEDPAEVERAQVGDPRHLVEPPGLGQPLAHDRDHPGHDVGIRVERAGRVVVGERAAEGARADGGHSAADATEGARRLFLHPCASARLVLRRNRPFCSASAIPQADVYRPPFSRFPSSRSSIALATRRCRVSSPFASAIHSAYCFRADGGRLPHVSAALEDPARASTRASGASTSRGASSRSSVTDTLSPGPTPAASRTSRFTTRKKPPPPQGMTVERNGWPSIVPRTATRVRAPSACATAAGIVTVVHAPGPPALSSVPSKVCIKPRARTAAGLRPPSAWAGRAPPDSGASRC